MFSVRCVAEMAAQDDARQPAARPDQGAENPTADAPLPVAPSLDTFHSVLEEDLPECRICREPGPTSPSDPEFHTFGLIAPCACSGSVRWVHRHCLRSWIASSAQTGGSYNSRFCNICNGAWGNGSPVDLPTFFDFLCAHTHELPTAPRRVVEHVFVDQCRDHLCCCILRLLFWSILLLVVIAQSRVVIWAVGLLLTSVIQVDDFIDQACLPDAVAALFRAYCPALPCFASVSFSKMQSALATVPVGQEVCHDEIPTDAGSPDCMAHLVVVWALSTVRNISSAHMSANDVVAGTIMFTCLLRWLNLPTALLPDPIGDLSVIIELLFPTISHVVHAACIVPSITYIARLALFKAGLVSPEAAPVNFLTGDGVAMHACLLLLVVAVATGLAEFAEFTAGRFRAWQMENGIDQFINSLSSPEDELAAPGRREATEEDGQRAAHPPVAAPTMDPPAAPTDLDKADLRPDWPVHGTGRLTLPALDGAAVQEAEEAVVLG